MPRRVSTRRYIAGVRGKKKLPFAGYSVVRTAFSMSSPKGPALFFTRWSGATDAYPAQISGATDSAGSQATKIREARLLEQVSGGHRRGVTPVPIPNTEVKPSTADGTACVSAWESRSLPGLILRPDAKASGLFLCASALPSKIEGARAAIGGHRQASPKGER